MTMKTALAVILFAAVVAPSAFAANTASSPQTKDANHELQEATRLVKQMKKDSEMARALAKAKGIFLVPDYGRGAFVVGGSGGQGVLFAKKNGEWVGPVFYNLGSVSIGAQAGVSAGQVAMVLMSDKAVNSFQGDNSFSLDANAGLTIVNWSARGQASLGTSDVIVWSDTEGAYAGVAFSASDINADEHANRAFYDTVGATPGTILTGRVHAIDPAARNLEQALGA